MGMGYRMTLLSRNWRDPCDRCCPCDCSAAFPSRFGSSQRPGSIWKGFRNGIGNGLPERKRGGTGLYWAMTPRRKAAQAAAAVVRVLAGIA
jgi:hypothetical protein